MVSFYNNTDHLRSLYISKFLYVKFTQIIKITRLVVSFVGSPSGLNIICLLFVLAFGFLPNIQNLTLRSKYATNKSIVRIGFLFYKQRDILSIFYKMPLLYFIFLDVEGSLFNTYSKQLSVFKTFLKFNYIFYTFFELDFIFNFAYNNMKFVTAYWYFELVIRGYYAESKTVDTFLRSMNWPICLSR